MAVVIELLSETLIPALLVAMPLYAYLKGVKVYETFIEGAKEAVTLAVRLLPYLVGMLVAINVFKASGLMGGLLHLLQPLLRFVGMPAEVVPLILLRPFSGSGTLAILSEILRTHGPDSFLGRLASTMQGSTETTFYVLSVYFGAVGVKDYRYALKVGLLADLAAALAALFFCRLIFS